MATSDEEDEICTQDEYKCVNEVVKAIMVLDHTKKPFKQSDISKFMSKKPTRKQWNDIIEKSKARLKEMGLTLLETKSTSSKSYILISNISPLNSMHRFADEKEVADRTLLILVLTFIFMKEGAVTHVDILNHLQELKIYNENRPLHPYFGAVEKKILNDFVSQLYLEKTSDKEAQTFEIKWGERSHAEVSKLSILEFVSEIGYEGTIQPKNFASHYQAVLEDEKAINRRKENEVMILD